MNTLKRPCRRSLPSTSRTWLSTTRMFSSRLLVPSFLGLLTCTTAMGCNPSEGKEAGKQTAAEAEEKKQAQIDALLQENGSAPLGKPAIAI